MPRGLIRYSVRMRLTRIGPLVTPPSPSPASTGRPAPPPADPPLPVDAPPVPGASPALPPAPLPGGRPPSEPHPAAINQVVTTKAATEVGSKNSARKTTSCLIGARP